MRPRAAGDHAWLIAANPGGGWLMPRCGVRRIGRPLPTGATQEAVTLCGARGGTRHGVRKPCAGARARPEVQAVAAPRLGAGKRGQAA